MKARKIRDRGKIKLSGYFKDLEIGDSVAIVRDLGVQAAFPKRVIGKTGKIVEPRGRHKVVEIKDGNKTKTFIIHPIHLKKLENKKK